MSKKGENLEIKIYELLGIKFFRKMAFGLAKIVLFPFAMFFPKEQREEIYNAPSNYKMKKGHGLKDLRDFKLMLLLNTTLHIVVLFKCFNNMPNYLEVANGSVSVFNAISNLIAVIINVYCIMLQRYNHIRINRALKKGEAIEEKQKDIVLGKINEIDSISKDLTFRVVNRKGKEKSINIEEFLEEATLQQLKDYKASLEILNGRENYYSRLGKDYEFVNEIPLEKGKSLVLERKRKRC